MLEVPLQLAIRLHAEAPSVTGYPSACWRSVCRYDPSRVGLEWEGHHTVQSAGFQILLLLILRTETVVEGLVTVVRTGTWVRL